MSDDSNDQLVPYSGTERRRLNFASQEQADAAEKIIQEAVARMVDALAGRLTTTEEKKFVAMALMKAEQAVKFRQAIIDKTLTALVWSVLVGLPAGAWVLIKEYMVNHGMWKP